MHRDNHQSDRMDAIPLFPQTAGSEAPRRLRAHSLQPTCEPAASVGPAVAVLQLARFTPAGSCSGSLHDHPAVVHAVSPPVYLS